MMESNPPAQPEELRRRILFLLKEAQRRVDYPYLSDIAKGLDETPEDIKDRLDIMKGLEEIEVTYFTDRDALPFITGKGKLELENMAKTSPQPDPPPISETSSQSQEFGHSADYGRVDWQGKRFSFNPMLSACFMKNSREAEASQGMRGSLKKASPQGSTSTLTPTPTRTIPQPTQTPVSLLVGPSIPTALNAVLDQSNEASCDGGWVHINPERR